MVHFSGGQSPWQNGPTERAGGIFKELLDKVIVDATMRRAASMASGREQWLTKPALEAFLASKASDPSAVDA